MKQSSAYSAFELDMINRLTGARSGCFILYSVECVKILMVMVVLNISGFQSSKTKLFPIIRNFCCRLCCGSRKSMDCSKQLQDQL